MFTRSLVAACVAAVCLAAPAFGVDTPRGRGPTAQALMDAQTVESGTGRVQVLNELCDVPSHLRRCVPITATLQDALERAIDRPITWVSHRHVDGPEFWVFAPVEFHAGTATSQYAWWDPGTSGCQGGITYDWQRHAGAWQTIGGIGWAACSAAG